MPCNDPTQSGPDTLDKLVERGAAGFEPATSPAPPPPEGVCGCERESRPWPRSLARSRVVARRASPCDIALLPQPGGFEGLGLEGEHVQARDLPTAEGVDEPENLLDGRTAASASRPLANPHDHPVARVYELLRARGELIEARCPISEHLKESLLPMPGSTVRVWTMGDEVGVVVIGNGGKI